MISSHRRFVFGRNQKILFRWFTNSPHPANKSRPWRRPTRRARSLRLRRRTCCTAAAAVEGKLGWGSPHFDSLCTPVSSSQDDSSNPNHTSVLSELWKCILLGLQLLHLVKPIVWIVTSTYPPFIKSWAQSMLMKYLWSSCVWALKDSLTLRFVNCIRPRPAEQNSWCILNYD